MGCDIHLYGEVKIEGVWHCYSHPNVPRCYALFALMADVRNRDGEIHPVSKPKGLPVDLSLPVAKAAAYWGWGAKEHGGGHSFSWLGAGELVKLEDQWLKVRKAMYPAGGWEGSDLDHHYFGYLEGNGWAGFARYPEDRKAWIEDVRLVFWFDN